MKSKKKYKNLNLKKKNLLGGVSNLNYKYELNNYEDYESEGERVIEDINENMNFFEQKEAYIRIMDEKKGNELINIINNRKKNAIIKLIMKYGISGPDALEIQIPQANISTNEFNYYLKKVFDTSKFGIELEFCAKIKNLKEDINYNWEDLAYIMEKKFNSKIRKLKSLSDFGSKWNLYTWNYYLHDRHKFGNLSTASGAYEFRYDDNGSLSGRTWTITKDNSIECNKPYFPFEIVSPILSMGKDPFIILQGGIKNLKNVGPIKTEKKKYKKTPYKFNKKNTKNNINRSKSNYYWYDIGPQNYDTGIENLKNILINVINDKNTIELQNPICNISKEKKEKGIEQKTCGLHVHFSNDFFKSNNELTFYSFTSLKSLNLPLLVAVNFNM